MEHFIQKFLQKESVTGMIFDVDGTILDSMPFWAHSGERYLASQGIQAPPSLGRALFSMTMRQGAEYMKQVYDMRQSPEEIMSGIIKIMTAAYQNEIALKPGILAFLNALQARGIPMTVVTSSDQQLVSAAFRRLALDGFFLDIITSTEFGSGKDRPEIFHAAAGRMNSSPSSTWVVEDGLYAVRTAKAAGYQAIGIFDEVSRDDEREMRQTADYFIHLG